MIRLGSWVIDKLPATDEYKLQLARRYGTALAFLLAVAIHGTILAVAVGYLYLVLR